MRFLSPLTCGVQQSIAAGHLPHYQFSCINATLSSVAAWKNQLTVRCWIFFFTTHHCSMILKTTTTSCHCVHSSVQVSTLRVPRARACGYSLTCRQDDVWVREIPAGLETGRASWQRWAVGSCWNSASWRI